MTHPPPGRRRAKTPRRKPSATEKIPGYHEGMSTEQDESEVKAPKVSKPRGFAAMSPEKQRELSRRGGEAAHRKGVAHRFGRRRARGRPQGGTRHPREA